MRFFWTLSLLALLNVPIIVLGQEQRTYEPLAGIPGISDTNPTLIQYLNQLFTLSIAIAAVFAMFRIVMSGFKYMVASDNWGNKEEAKGEITAVITGLVVLLLSVIILAQINPELIKLNILQQK